MFSKDHLVDLEHFLLFVDGSLGTNPHIGESAGEILHSPCHNNVQLPGDFPTPITAYLLGGTQSRYSSGSALLCHCISSPPPPAEGWCRSWYGSWFHSHISWSRQSNSSIQSIPRQQLDTEENSGEERLIYHNSAVSCFLTGWRTM